ncbi:hypothetical protein PAMA_020086 [Pampus argenteus]
MLRVQGTEKNGLRLRSSVVLVTPNFREKHGGRREERGKEDAISLRQSGVFSPDWQVNQDQTAQGGW